MRHISNCSIFHVEEDCYKINNLIVAYSLNILCKRGGIKWHNCCQRTVYVTQLLTYTFTYMYIAGVYRPGKLF